MVQDEEKSLRKAEQDFRSDQLKLELFTQKGEAIQESLFTEQPATES